MKPPNPHRPPSRLAPALACAGLALALGACFEDRLAGTSVGTGNPGVVTLGFTEGAAAVRLSGRVELFSPRHNPLVDSLPLAAFAVADQDSLQLLEDTLLPILRRVDTTTDSDSDFAVNVLLRTPEGKGAWHRGLAFALRGGKLAAVRPDARVDLPVAPLVSYQGAVQLADTANERRYLTLFGSPFYGKVAAGAFALDSLPAGRYEALLVRFQPDVPLAGGRKPSPVHSLDDSLDTGSPARLTPSADPVDTIPLPPEGPREDP